MNERIKELVSQANMEIDPAHPNHNQKVLGKFANLIVKECIEISGVGSITEDKIYKHFGVE